MLVAQALSEPLNLVTHDSQVAAYSPGFILVQQIVRESGRAGWRSAENRSIVA